MSDLNMLVMAGGRERTEEEWRDLLALPGGFNERVDATGFCFRFGKRAPALTLSCEVELCDRCASGRNLDHGRDVRRDGFSRLE